MLKKLFTKGPTSKSDVAMALGAVIVAAYKAIETIQDYKADHTNKEINK